MHLLFLQSIRIALKEKCKLAVIGDLKSAAKSGNIEEYKACLEEAKTLGGMDEETNLIEETWNATRAGVNDWLVQITEGWEAGRQEIVTKIKEAKRLGLNTVAVAAETMVAAREKDLMER
jgi:hypothetical protein